MTRIGTKHGWKMAGATTIALAVLASCASPADFFGMRSEPDTLPPISNPFGKDATPNLGTKVRSRVGDKFTELELPRGEGVIESYSLPGQNLDGSSVADEDEKTAPTQSDYEILSKVKRTNIAEDADRRAIERELGVRTLDGETPTQRRSVLAQLDRIKQLYRTQRFESALVKIDALLIDVPTLPVLYQMRGTLLERLGHGDLALQSWKQALKLEPANVRLKKLIDRRERNRGLAGVSIPTAPTGGGK